MGKKFSAGFWKSYRGVQLLPVIRLVNNQYLFMIQFGWWKWNFDLEWEK